MEQANKNKQRRGELRLENSESISNTVLENSESENDGIPMYTVENSELDNLLDEAATSKAEFKQQEKAEQASEQQEKQTSVSAEDAMKLAAKGLNQITKVASDFSGKEIVLGELPTTLFILLTTPLIQKYKPKISIDPDEVDIDSWVPELMAVGGLGVAGLPIWLQLKNEPEKEEVTHGDKREHSA